MNKNDIYLENFDNVSDDVKYITNSIVRLKILAMLYDKPRNIKELTNDGGLIYSSVLGNMHDLEVEGFIYRESNRYYLTNSMKVIIEDILEFVMLMDIINNFFNILDNHIVDIIPTNSVMEFYLLGKAVLIESDDIDVYKTLNFIENSLRNAECVRCILPVYYENFNHALNMLVEDKKFVEVLVSRDVLPIFEKNSKIMRLSAFERDDNFLLIVTDKSMMLGLFSEDGYFDQNRLLTSKNEDSLKWANNLYENFKKER